MDHPQKRKNERRTRSQSTEPGITEVGGGNTAGQRSGEAVSPASSVLTPEAKRATNELEAIRNLHDRDMVDEGDPQDKEQLALRPRQLLPTLDNPNNEPPASWEDMGEEALEIEEQPPSLPADLMGIAARGARPDDANSLSSTVSGGGGGS